MEYFQVPIPPDKSQILKEMEELASLIEYCKANCIQYDDHSDYYRQYETALRRLETIETIEMLDRCYQK